MAHIPTALILDFGGVLTTDLWASVRACARHEGLPDNALLDLLRGDPKIHPLNKGLECGEVDQIEFEAHLGAAAGISPDRLLARMCAALRPDQTMLDAVAVLRRAGTRIGILSNSWGSGYFSPYEGYDLENRADALVFSDQVRLRKPEPAIFHLMLDKLGVTATDSVFVDDLAANLVPASELGMRTIHHVDTRQTLAHLELVFRQDLGTAA